MRLFPSSEIVDYWSLNAYLNPRPNYLYPYRSTHKVVKDGLIIALPTTEHVFFGLVNKKGDLLWSKRFFIGGSLYELFLHGVVEKGNYLYLIVTFNDSSAGRPRCLTVKIDKSNYSVVWYTMNMYENVISNYITSDSSLMFFSYDQNTNYPAIKVRNLNTGLLEKTVKVESAILVVSLPILLSHPSYYIGVYTVGDFSKIEAKVTAFDNEFNVISSSILNYGVSHHLIPTSAVLNGGAIYLGAIGLLSTWDLDDSAFFKIVDGNVDWCISTGEFVIYKMGCDSLGNIYLLLLDDTSEETKIAKFNPQGSIVYCRLLSTIAGGSRIENVGMEITDSILISFNYIESNEYFEMVCLKLPLDGSKTGVIGDINYSVSSLSIFTKGAVLSDSTETVEFGDYEDLAPPVVLTIENSTDIATTLTRI